MIVRAGLVAAAVAVAAWLLVGLHSSRLEYRAIGLATPRDGQLPSKDQLAEAFRLLRDARAGNAGTTPEVGAAQLYVFIGNRRAAIEVLEDVVRREPDNYEAWLLVARAADGVDPRLAARARARLAVLSPPVPLAE